MKQHYFVTSLFFFISLATLTVSATPCLAHKLNVFSYEEEGVMVVEATFSGGRPVKNSSVTVTIEDDGTRLLSGTTDAKGIFRFPLPQQIIQHPQNMTVTVSPGDGHKGNWLITTDDYSAGRNANISSPQNTRTSSSLQEKTVANRPQCDPTLIRKIVSEELTPIKKALAEQQVRSVSLQDILGGIGYILGLLGLATYIKSKKTGDKK